MKYVIKYCVSSEVQAHAQQRSGIKLTAGTLLRTVVQTLGFFIIMVMSAHEGPALFGLNFGEITFSKIY